jgi:hypothetical protein
MDEISIRTRAAITKEFGIDLMKLSKPSLLRALVPKHGSDGKQLLDRIILI